MVACQSDPKQNHQGHHIRIGAAVITRETDGMVKGDIIILISTQGINEYSRFFLKITQYYAVFFWCHFSREPSLISDNGYNEMQ